MTTFLPFEIASFQTLDQISKQNYENVSGKHISFRQLAGIDFEEEWKIVTTVLNLKPDGSRDIDVNVEQKSIDAVFKAMNQLSPKFESYTHTVSKIKGQDKSFFSMSLFPCLKSHTTNVVELNQVLQISSRYTPLFINISGDTGEQWYEQFKQYIQYSIFVYSATYAIIVSKDELQDYTMFFVKADNQTHAKFRLSLNKR